MGYQISSGIPEPELATWLKNGAAKFGTFDDGRINYKNADIAPIVMCTVVYKDKLLLVKRGYGLADAEDYWSTVNGFIDEIKPVKQQAKQEIKEELNLAVSEDIIKVAPSYTLSNSKEKRTYIVFPCLITLSIKPTIELDSENTELAWITREELESHHILEDLPYAIDSALNLICN